VGLGATLWNSGWDRRGVEHRVTGPDLWVPIALWLLLGGYLVFGAWYRGKVPRTTNLPWRARVIGSGALALMVFAVIVYRTGKCGERNRERTSWLLRAADDTAGTRMPRYQGTTRASS